jgi:hypothetical protein
METSWNQLIERYLNNELSKEGMLSFEQELSENAQLKAEFDAHVLIREGIIRAAQRQEIQKIGKQYVRMKRLKWIGLLGVVLVLLGSIGYAIRSNQPQTNINELDANDFKGFEKHLKFEGIVPEYFDYKGGSALFESQNGVLVSLAPGSLLKNNRPYNGPAFLQWQEAIHAADIVKAGLSAESNGQLLATQGMFSLQVFTPNGEQLQVSQEPGIYVQVPVSDYQSGMKLYHAAYLENGAINWVNPEELEKLPQVMPMSSLNFYPPNFEPSLDQLHWKTGRVQRDSLYRSFEDWGENVLEYQVMNQLDPSEISDKKFYFQVDSVVRQEPIPGKKHISPSKVMAIWNKKFDNTIFATMDFEKRMKAIHATCNEAVFNCYANQPNKKIWELDEQVVKMGYPEFEKFAKERVGGIQLSNAHINNLRHYYRTGIAQLRSKTKQERNLILNQEKQWDMKLQRMRTKEMKRSSRRISQNIQEEYQFNLKNVALQLGCSVGFQLHGGGTVVNIDKLVYDATLSRTSITIIDPTTGKKATINYRPFEVTIEKSEQFERLFLYLFSKELNTYQRIDPCNKQFRYSLNEAMNYNLVFVGMNETTTALKVIPGATIQTAQRIELTAVSEEKFAAVLNEFENKRIKSSLSIANELEWLFLEKQNYKVQRLRMENQLFRARIVTSIYSCLNEKDTTTIAEEIPIIFK